MELIIVAGMVLTGLIIVQVVHLSALEFGGKNNIPSYVSQTVWRWSNEIPMAEV